MPTGSRVRANNVYGTVTDNPLLIGAVSFTSLGLSLLPAISGQHAVIVLDPKRVFGEPEIVVVTSHLAMGTTATITRAQYGTVARQHPQGTAWAHVPVNEDYIEILTSGTRPSNPYLGQIIFETDTEKFVARNAANSSWVDAFSVGSWTTYTPTNTNITLGSGTQSARYIKMGRMVIVNYQILWGAGTSWTTPAFGLPFPSANVAGTLTGHGSVLILDAGVNDYSAGVFVNPNSSVAFVRVAAGGGITATIPFTWTTSDRLSFTLTYESAS